MVVLSLPFRPSLPKKTTYTLMQPGWYAFFFIYLLLMSEFSFQKQVSSEPSLVTGVMCSLGMLGMDDWLGTKVVAVMCLGSILPGLGLGHLLDLLDISLMQIVANHYVVCVYS
jgi:hypothetical protein